MSLWSIYRTVCTTHETNDSGLDCRSFLGLYRGRSVPPGMSPVGEFRAGRHVNGTLLCMPVTPVRRRRRKASASRLRTAEDDDNRRGPGSAWTYVPSHQNARFSRRRVSFSLASEKCIDVSGQKLISSLPGFRAERQKTIVSLFEGPSASRMFVGPAVVTGRFGL